MSEARVVVPVSLPKGLAQRIDEFVEKGVFSSRSEALRFGARIVTLPEGRLHERSEDYAYSMIKERLGRAEVVS